MKPNSIETLYQRIYVRKEFVLLDESRTFEHEIKFFILSQMKKRGVELGNSLFDEMLDQCIDAVMITLSKRMDKDYKIMPYLTTVIHNTISHTFKNHYVKGEAVQIQSLEQPISHKENYTLIDTIADENSYTEEDILHKLSQQYLARNVCRDYSSRREFEWLIQETNGKTDKEIAKEYRISNSYVSRQTKALKLEIRDKYANDYHSII